MQLKHLAEETGADSSQVKRKKKAAFSEEQVFFYILSSDFCSLTEQTPRCGAVAVYLCRTAFNAPRSCQTDRAAFEMNRPPPLLMPPREKKKQDVIQWHNRIFAGKRRVRAGHQPYAEF